MSGREAGHKVQTYVSTQIWDFFNISKFLASSGLKYFSNSWANSYTMCVMLDIKFRSPCGESDLC